MKTASAAMALILGMITSSAHADAWQYRAHPRHVVGTAFARSHRLSRCEDKSAVTNEHDAVRKNPPGRNLAKGKAEALAGRVIDARSRPADALIVLYDAKGKVVGHINSVGARFSMRDVGAGTYKAKVYSRRGGAPTEQRVKVEKSKGQVVIKVK